MEFLMDNTARETGFTEVWERVKPLSEPGRRYKRDFKPFLPEDRDYLREELDRMEILLAKIESNPTLFDDLASCLKDLKDLTPLLHSLLQETVLSQFELFEIKKMLGRSKKISRIIQRVGISFISFPEDELAKLWQSLFKGGGASSFVLADSYSPELRHVRSRRRTIEDRLRKERQELWGKIEELIGFKIPVTGEFIISRLEQEKINRLQELSQVRVRRETVGYLTFQVCDSREILHLQKKLEEIRREEESLERKVLKALSEEVYRQRDLLQSTCRELGYLDFLLAKALFCREKKLVRPEILQDERGTYISSGRHPVVEERLEEMGLEFQPVSLKLQGGVTLLTGPNMGGKTVSLKMVGLAVAMFQYGLFVPCAGFASQLYTFIYLSSHRDETLHSGLSVFGREIYSLRKALEREGSGLLLLDELAHGTNPPEAEAFCRAFIEYLMTRKLVVLITTHYPGLALLRGIKHLQVRGFGPSGLNKLSRSLNKGDISPGDLIAMMDFSIREAERVEEVPRNALLVAEALGFPGEIIARARRILEKEKEE